MEINSTENLFLYRSLQLAVLIKKKHFWVLLKNHIQEISEQKEPDPCMEKIQSLIKKRNGKASEET